MVCRQSLIFMKKKTPQKNNVTQSRSVWTHSHILLSYLLLLNVCFPTLVSAGLGRWSVPVCYWTRPAHSDLFAALPLAVCTGTEVNGSSFLVCACFGWPSLEERGANLGWIRTHFSHSAKTPKPWWKSTRLTPPFEQVHYSKCCNTGGTNSALCLSSARIWSLGFREYLCMIRKKEKKENAISYTRLQKKLYLTNLSLNDGNWTRLENVSSLKKILQLCFINI